MHYGHPDVFDRVFHITRGGISKASRVINISEDIFAGMAVCFCFFELRLFLLKEQCVAMLYLRYWFVLQTYWMSNYFVNSSEDH